MVMNRQRQVVEERQSKLRGAVAQPVAPAPATPAAAAAATPVTPSPPKPADKPVASDRVEISLQEKLDSIEASVKEDVAAAELIMQKEITEAKMIEAFTMIGTALNKLFAAQQGLRDNVDMSGIQVYEPDFNKASQAGSQFFRTQVGRIQEEARRKATGAVSAAKLGERLTEKKETKSERKRLEEKRDAERAEAKEESKRLEEKQDERYERTQSERDRLEAKRDEQYAASRDIAEGKNLDKLRKDALTYIDDDEKFTAILRVMGMPKEKIVDLMGEGGGFWADKFDMEEDDQTKIDAVEEYIGRLRKAKAKTDAGVGGEDDKPLTGLEKVKKAREDLKRKKEAAGGR